MGAPTRLFHLALEEERRVKRLSLYDIIILQIGELFCGKYSLKPWMF